MSLNRTIREAQSLIIEIAKVGKNNPSKPLIQEISPFKNYHDERGMLILRKLDSKDDGWTRREILTRYLLINAVLDQGPDTEGVRLLLKEVINYLYGKGIRFLHKPIEFFRGIGIVNEAILEKHEMIRGLRAQIWANVNKSRVSKYNLFLDNTKQILNYTVFRWGVPLSLPLILEKEKKGSPEPLVDYIESWDSAEKMCQQIKDDERFGLGKAIGDKAAHLFAKLYIHVFRLAKRKEISWGPLSYELPLNSNAGRVLFRTGFWLKCADLKDYKNWEVIQEGKGKGGTNYIRVTNIRGRKSDIFSAFSNLMDIYKELCRDYLKIKQRPIGIEIQHIPNLLLLHTNYGIGNLDDGLIYIGTNFCFNHSEPLCDKCPIECLCEGKKGKYFLIYDYRT